MGSRFKRMTACLIHWFSEPLWAHLLFSTVRRLRMQRCTLFRRFVCSHIHLSFQLFTYSSLYLVSPLFIYSCICSFIHLSSYECFRDSIIRSFIIFIHLLMDPFIQSSIYVLIHLPMHSLISSCNHSFKISMICSLIHPLVKLFIPVPTCSFIALSYIH